MRRGFAGGPGYALAVVKRSVPHPESAASDSSLLEAIARRQQRMERRQRRIELGLVVLLMAVLAGHLASGRSGAITATIVAAALIGYAWVVRGVRIDAADRPVPPTADPEADPEAD